MNRAGPTPAPATVKRIDVFLKPGEYFVGDASHRIRTVLGSCVSVALWEPHRRVGAMSHFLLASRGGSAKPGFPTREWDAKFGDEALHLMLRELNDRHVTAAQCLAKIFGGGDMFPSLKASGGLAVGRRNGEATLTLLQEKGIKVISESLFGEGHRQIIFDVGTGHVWARQVRPNSGFTPLPPDSAP